MTVALASVSDFLARVGTVDDLTRVGVLLKDASAAFRRAAGNQQIHLVEDDEARIRPDCGSLYLPQAPVIEVSTIVDADANDVDFTWELGQTLSVYSITAGHSFERDLVFPPSPLTVTYTHGYDPVPDDVIAVVCQVAARAYGTSPLTSAVSQESLGVYSYSIGSAGASGPVGLLPAELAIARSYRLPGRPVTVL